MKAWTKIGASGQVAVLGLVGVSAAFGLWRLVEAPPVPQKESLTEIVAEQSAAPVRGEGDPVAEEPPQSLAATDMPQEAPEGAEAPVDTVQAPSLTPSEPSLSETAEESSAPLAPQILTWLVTPDGSATIAGRSEPEAEISVLVDEIPVAIVKATRAGEFAVVAALAPNPEPSLLRVMAKLSDGREIAAKEVIALAPIAGLKGMEVQASADIGADTAGGGLFGAGHVLAAADGTSSFRWRRCAFAARGALGTCALGDGALGPDHHL